MLRKFYFWLYIVALFPAAISTLTGSILLQALMMLIIVAIYYYYKVQHHTYMYEKYEDIVGPKQKMSDRRTHEKNLNLIKTSLPRDPEVIKFITEQSKLKTWTVLVVISFLFVLYFR